MKRRLRILLVVPLVVALAACAPVVSHSSPPTTHHTAVAAAQSATPTPTSAPVAVDSDDYLINGQLNPTVNPTGSQYGEWAFFTDTSKQVWCEFTIFDSDAPGAYCALVGSGKTARSYAVPAGVVNGCDMSSSLPVDGYSLGLALEGFPDGTQAGFGGCSDEFFDPAADLAKTKVLPSGGSISVPPFACSSQDSVATCHYTNTYSGGSGTITLGVHVATFAQN